MLSGTLHKLFHWGIWLKGLHALLELVGGAALAFISTAKIAQITAALTQEELNQDPKDFIANYLNQAAAQLSLSSKTFAAVYLLVHGAVKLFLVVGLLKNKHWAYPAALTVFGIFILYQIYRFAVAPSWPLILLTLFDLVVIWLIWQEYQFRKNFKSTDDSLQN